MAEPAKTEANPFAQFVVAPHDATADTGAEVNPFAAFAAPPDTQGTAEAGATKQSLEPFSPEVSVEDAQRMVRYLKGAPAGIVRGMIDIPEALLQLGARAGEAIMPEGSAAKNFMTGQRRDVEQFQKEGEDTYQKEFSQLKPGEFDPGRMVGNVAATAPLAGVMPGAGAAGAIPRLASGAVAGGVTGALQPVEPGSDDFWAEKAKQAGLGAAGGTIAPVVGGAAARVISPKVSGDVTALMNQGITPTPGQILGGSANRIEEAAQSIPLIGDAIKSARARAVGDLNRSAINRTLEPIGESLDSATPLGRDAIAEMHEKIGANYDKLVPTLSVKADPQFATNLKTIAGMTKFLPPETRDQFGNALQSLVVDKFSPTGHMSGQTFKDMESELGRLATGYTNSSVANERQLGGAFKQLQVELRQLLMRSNPDKAAELTAANSAYADALRVQGAAAKTGTEQGVFTPAQLLQSIRELDPSLRKGAFARGEARMQDLGDAAKSVLGNKVPDSGTPLRSFVMGAGALAPLYAWNPLAAAGAAGAVGTGAAAYSRPGVNLLAKLLAVRPQGAADVAKVLRSPSASPLAGLIASQQSGAPGP